MGKLVLFLADGTTLDIPLDRERLTVGRRSGNDVCLPYVAVSAAHAAFVTTPAGVVIEDLGSTNGTMINGKRTLRQVVRDGDRIEIGRQRLVYLADVDAAVPPLTRREPAADRADDGRGGPATDPAAASSGAATAASPGESGPAPRPDDALASAMPAATAESWLSEPGPKGSPAAGNPAARFAYADTTNARAAKDPTPASPATSSASAGPLLKVLTGPSAGQTLALTRDEALIGRAGRQVVAVRKADNAYRLFLAEGALVPRVNGAPVPPEGVLLQPDDAIEVAGAHLVFLKGADALSS
jgi:hypothetical protein